MAKSKRNPAKCNINKSSAQLTRKDAINIVIKEMAKTPTSTKARKMIVLFGLTAEELSEAGMSYELLRSLDGILH